MTRYLHQVFLGIGSNIDAELNIGSALKSLETLHREMTTSRTYQGEAIGFCGPPFLNLVVGIMTHKSLTDLSLSLKEIEKNHGRVGELEKYSSRTMDIDILIYDDLVGTHSGIELPRPEIRLNAYVLRPFAELTPQLILPGSMDRLEELWRSFDQASQPLVEMTVCW
ncbi:MAG: 2-amino-4-hydroxy-6-hydroxymethyldihydropteridine diphosphokinase [Gammaproteobacteria bacterium]|nr:2-amino-4-hydroxy-6-hydroxymethyldihydropteridine diphosphokinase [Gammaproteobacteria bacterium]